MADCECGRPIVTRRHRAPRRPARHCGRMFVQRRRPHEHRSRNRCAGRRHARLAPSHPCASRDRVRGGADVRVCRREVGVVRARSPSRHWRRPASSACCATARRRKRWECAPTWTRCTSPKNPASRMRRPTQARCTRAATTAIRRCCLAPRKAMAQRKNFDGTAYFIFQPAEENEGGGRVMVRGRPVRPLPDEGRVRHAQLAGHAGRHDRAAFRSADGRLRHLRDHRDRQRRARRNAAPEPRPDAVRRARHQRAADDRRAQYPSTRRRAWSASRRCTAATRGT